tara:strand:- start:341 stop:826 length:486 start_codon:yes stop_codon:yes gene_type:complete
MRSYLKLIFCALLVVVLDYSTKVSALYYLTSHPLELTPFLSLQVAYNCGIAFSLFDTCTVYNQLLLSLLSIGVCTYIIYISTNHLHIPGIFISITLIIGGAAGNILDRVLYGYVIDFIRLHYKSYFWPTFNLADSFVVIGILLFLLCPAIYGDKVKALNKY